MRSPIPEYETKYTRATWDFGQVRVRVTAAAEGWFPCCVIEDSLTAQCRIAECEYWALLRAVLRMLPWAVIRYIRIWKLRRGLI